MHIYIYMYTHRERERDVHTYVYICIYIYIYNILYTYNHDDTTPKGTCPLREFTKGSLVNGALAIIHVFNLHTKNEPCTRETHKLLNPPLLNPPL